MSADIPAGPATGATSFAFPRLEQTFPTLTPPEIERMRRFGELRTYKDGEALFETGKPGPGMFVVLSGHVAITQRDGLGHVTPVIDQGPGQFLAEIGQLSDRVALVDGHAEGDVETLLIRSEKLRALLVAEADLGERIMRALILRRVSLIQGGVGGPVLIGPSSPATASRITFSIPPPTRTPPTSSRAIRTRAPICRWWSVPTAPCCAIPPRPSLRWRWA
jgi:thioredoxin reductase (NADPH)